VVSGDTPLGIAAKLNIPAGQRDAWVADLLRLNSVTATTIRVGQVLRLPPTPGAAPATGSPAPAGTTSAPASTPRP
jgi:LysM repeat protein